MQTRIEPGQKGVGNIDTLGGDPAFWCWLANNLHRVPQLAGLTREQLDTLATLLRAEASPWGPH